MNGDSLAPASRRSRRIRILGIGCVLLAWLLAIPPSQGQSTPAEEAARAADRQQREELERQRRQFEQDRASARAPTRLELPPVPVPTGRGPAVLKYPIRTLQIDGATRMTARFRTKLAARFTGREIGVEDVEQLLAEITRYYLRKGHVATRAYLPDQDLTTGTLRVLVLEGVVERLELGPAAFGRTLPASAVPVRTGAILNLRDIEQGLDQLNRLRSNNATVAIEPGSKPGDSIVRIPNQPGRIWHLNASADNTGSLATGREQISGGLTADNLLGYADSLSLYHRRAADYRPGRHASEATTGSLSVPWGYQLVTVGGSLSSYALTLHPPSGVDIASDGNNRLAFLRVDRVLYRDQRTRLSASASLTWKSAENYLLGQLLTVSSRDSVVLDLGVNASTAWWGGYLSGDLTVSSGQPWFGAAGDPAGLPGYAPHSEFVKVAGSLSYSRPFELAGVRFSFSSALSGQFADELLYGADQVTATGLYSVRGFDATSLAGDAGYVWRNDLTANFSTRLGKHVLAIAPYIGLDHGCVWTQMRGSRGDRPDEGSVAGATLGVGLNSGSVRLEVFFSESLTQPAALTPESGRLYVRGSVSY